MCRRLGAIVDGLPQRPSGTATAEIMSFLQEDLPLHLSDEEECLFPLLRAKSLVGDPIDEWTHQLCEEHAADLLLSSQIAECLNELTATVQKSDSQAETEAVQMLARTARRFAECPHRHAQWEDIVILPHAVLRFSPSDWRRLGAELSARRSET